MFIKILLSLMRKIYLKFMLNSTEITLKVLHFPFLSLQWIKSSSIIFLNSFWIYFLPLQYFVTP